MDKEQRGGGGSRDKGSGILTSVTREYLKRLNPGQAASNGRKQEARARDPKNFNNHSRFHYMLVLARGLYRLGRRKKAGFEWK